MAEGNSEGWEVKVRCLEEKSFSNKKSPDVQDFFYYSFGQRTKL
jgi:hypothetical protein